MHTCSPNLSTFLYQPGAQEHKRDQTNTAFKHEPIASLWEPLRRAQVCCNRTILPRQSHACMYQCTKTYNRICDKWMDTCLVQREKVMKDKSKQEMRFVASHAASHAGPLCSHLCYVASTLLNLNCTVPVSSFFRAAARKARATSTTITAATP